MFFFPQSYLIPNLCPFPFTESAALENQATGRVLNIRIVKIQKNPRGFPGGSEIKNLPAMQETRVRSLGWEDTLEEGMATHSNTLAWGESHGQREKPGRLQSTGSHKSWIRLKRLSSNSRKIQSTKKANTSN